MDETRSAARAAGTIALGAFLLLILYAASYLLLVERRPGVTTGCLHSQTTVYWAEYRVIDPLAQRIFGPAHAVDQRVRPGYWVEETALPAIVVLHEIGIDLPAPVTAAAAPPGE